MGGVLILLAVTVATLLWADMTNPHIWVLLVVTIGFGAIGFADDAMKLLNRSHRGLNIRIKVVAQLVLAVGGRLLGYDDPGSAARSRPRAAVRQVAAHRHRLVLRAVCRLRGHRLVQCGEPDRRPRRSGDRADHGRRRGASR